MVLELGAIQRTQRRSRLDDAAAYSTTEQSDRSGLVSARDVGGAMDRRPGDYQGRGRVKERETTEQTCPSVGETRLFH